MRVLMWVGSSTTWESPSAVLTRGLMPAETAGERGPHGRHGVIQMCEGEQRTLCLQSPSAADTHLHSENWKNDFPHMGIKVWQVCSGHSFFINTVLFLVSQYSDPSLFILLCSLFLSSCLAT